MTPATDTQTSVKAVPTYRRCVTRCMEYKFVLFALDLTLRFLDKTISKSKIDQERYRITENVLKGIIS